MAPGRRQTCCSAHVLNIYRQRSRRLRFALQHTHAKHELGLLRRWNCQVILLEFKLCFAVISNLQAMITLAYSVALYGLKKVLIFPRDKATVSAQPP
jgi:hypothetical protein